VPLIEEKDVLSTAILVKLLELLTFGGNMAFTLSRVDDAKRIARIAGKMVLDFIDSTNECFMDTQKGRTLIHCLRCA
jgi:hypothetical protein